MYVGIEAVARGYIINKKNTEETCLVFVRLVAKALHFLLDVILLLLDARQLALRLVQLGLHVVEVVDVLLLLALKLDRYQSLIKDTHTHSVMRLTRRMT